MDKPKAVAKSVITYSSQMLRLRPYQARLGWMAICGLATFIPLLIGLIQHDVAHAIFGGLSGYLVGLGDHLGTRRNRLVIATLGSCGNLVFFSAGVLLQNHFFLFTAVATFAVYGLGLFGGLGFELERLTLLSIIQLLVGRYLGFLNASAFLSVAQYFLYAYLTIVFVIFVSSFTFQKRVGNFKTVKDSILHFLSPSPAQHYYAFSYATAVLIALFLAEQFHIERGYWIVVTTVLIFKPDDQETLYRIFQRMFGTLLGVGTAGLILSFDPNQLALLTLASGCSFLVPFVWSRNYWLVSLLATNLVLMLLSIAHYGMNRADADHLTHVRFIATLYGCGISLLSIVSFKFIRILWRKRVGQS